MAQSLTWVYLHRETVFVYGGEMRQGRSGLSELLCLSRRANKERVATARQGAQK